MHKITESNIEQLSIDLLKSLGYQYIFEPDIAPDSEKNDSFINNRKSYSDVILFDVLKSALIRINPDIHHRNSIRLSDDITTGTCRGVHTCRGAYIDRGEHAVSPLHVLVREFERMTTSEYICAVKNCGNTIIGNTLLIILQFGGRINIMHKNRTVGAYL